MVYPKYQEHFEFQENYGYFGTFPFLFLERLSYPDLYCFLNSFCMKSECAVCFGEFGKEVHERAFFKDCGHANICSTCAEKLWKAAKTKKKKMECPTCKTVQEKKFILLPVKVYT